MASASAALSAGGRASADGAGARTGAVVPASAASKPAVNAEGLA
jgi:hypothetical protein